MKGEIGVTCAREQPPWHGRAVPPRPWRLRHTGDDTDVSRCRSTTIEVREGRGEEQRSSREETLAGGGGVNHPRQSEEKQIDAEARMRRREGSPGSPAATAGAAGGDQGTSATATATTSPGGSRERKKERDAGWTVGAGRVGRPTEPFGST